MNDGGVHGDGDGDGDLLGRALRDFRNRLLAYLLTCSFMSD